MGHLLGIGGVLDVPRTLEESGEARRLPRRHPSHPIRLSLGGSVATVAHFRFAGRDRGYNGNTVVVNENWRPLLQAARASVAGETGSGS